MGFYPPSQAKAQLIPTIVGRGRVHIRIYGMPERSQGRCSQFGTVRLFSWASLCEPVKVRCSQVTPLTLLTPHAHQVNMLIWVLELSGPSRVEISGPDEGYKRPTPSESADPEGIKR